MTLQAKKLPEEDKITERIILSKVARVFYLLSLARVLLSYVQKSSYRKCGPRALTGTSLLITNFQVEQKNVSELEALQEISVPRCLQESKRLKSVSVQTFVDASSKAYGAVSYLRSEYAQ